MDHIHEQQANVSQCGTQSLLGFLTPDGKVDVDHLKLFLEEGKKKTTAWTGLQIFFNLLENPDAQVQSNTLELLDILCDGFQDNGSDNLSEIQEMVS
jgi:hypothetical protein